MSTVSSKLKSSDGVILSVHNTDLERSETLSSMLDFCPENQEGGDEEIVLEKIHSKHLSVIIEWLQNTVLPDDLSVPDLLQLVVHVNYLNIPDLLNLCCHTVVEKLMSEKRDGTFNLVTEPTCFYEKCVQTFPYKLSVCSKCKVAKYCSRQCQQNDWYEHKNTCKKITKQSQIMEWEAEDLRCIFSHDLFKAHYGFFFDIHQTRDYCRVRYNVAKILIELANKKRHKHVYDAACAHYLSLLRLVYRDNMSIRDQLPFLLLKLNRDEDCYNFIKWWITVGPGEPSDSPESKDGDWLYLTNQDVYEDPMSFIHGHGRPDNLSFYVAVLCIKLRLVAKCEAQFHAVSKIEEAAAREAMRPLLDVLPNLTKLVFGDSSRAIRSRDLRSEISKQSYYTERLMQLIGDRNISFFPALLNPRPLLSKPDPKQMSHNTAEETHFVLKLSIDILTAIPTAVARITAMVGHDPEYDPAFIFPAGYSPLEDFKGIIKWHVLDPESKSKTRVCPTRVYRGAVCPTRNLQGS